MTSFYKKKFHSGYKSDPLRWAARSSWPRAKTNLTEVSSASSVEEDLSYIIFV